ncbi:hypothetical protein FOZ63_003779, partial [Perkinsus olseni]
MLSVRWGREPAVEVLTEMDDVAVNMSSPVDQRTPLHVAVKDLKVEIVSLLLDAGANPLILDDADLTTINYATSEFDAEGLKIGVQPVVLRRRDTAMSSIMLMASQGKGKAAAAADAVETMKRDKGPPERISEISVAVIEIRNILAIALASNGASYDEIYDDTSSSSSSSSSSSGGSSALDGDSSNAVGVKSDQGGLSANRRTSSSSLLAERRMSTFLPGSLSSPSLGNTERNCSVGAMRALLKSGVEPTLVDPTTEEPLLLL